MLIILCFIKYDQTTHTIIQQSYTYFINNSKIHSGKTIFRITEITYGHQQLKPKEEDGVVNLRKQPKSEPAQSCRQIPPKL